MLGSLRAALGPMAVILAGCAADPVSRASTCRPDSWNTDSVFSQSEFRTSIGRSSFPDSSSTRVEDLNRSGLAVFTVRWRAPNAGALLLVDCAGTMRFTLPSAYVDSTTTWAESGHRPALIALYTTSAQATGFSESRIALVIAEDSALRLVFEHPTAIANHGPGKHSTELYTVRFLDSLAIEVQLTGGGSEQRRRWVWSPSTAAMEHAPRR